MIGKKGHCNFRKVIYRRNRVLALCAGERRLLVKALLSFRNKLVASGKPTEDINELLIRLLR